MEQKESLIIGSEELTSILAKHYFWVDFQTKEDCYSSTCLEIKSKDEAKNKVKFNLY